MSNAATKLKSCPYCQSAIDPNAVTVECSVCKIPHHEECWQESGRCTTYGCNGSPTRAFPSRGAVKLTPVSVDVNSAMPPPLPYSQGGMQPPLGSIPPPLGGPPPLGASPPYGQPMPYGNKQIDPSVALILSIIFCGAGHFYLGRPGRGLAFFFGAFFGGFLLYVPGIAIYVWSVFDAHNLRQQMQNNPQSPSNRRF